MTEARRAALVDVAAELGLPIVEDNPYGDLWFDQPAAGAAGRAHPEGTIYLGSFSKVLAPGLRLGFLVAPPALYPKLLQAKQAADLHSPSFNQRMAARCWKATSWTATCPRIRALYRAQRDAMLAALEREMAGLGVEWNRPDGGMFLWARLPRGMDARRTCCRRRWSAAWPSCPAPPSMPTRRRRHAHPAPVVRHGDGGADRHRHRRPRRGHPRGAAAVIQLWGRLSSINVRKVVLTLRLLELPFERHEAGGTFGVVRTPDYLARNPNALVPLLGMTASRCGSPTSSCATSPHATPRRASTPPTCASASTPSAGWTGSRRP